MKNLFKTSGNLAEAETVVFPEQELDTAQDKTLVILQDFGFDSGNFANIKVSFGMVDVRTLSSEINVEDGYQRELKAHRLEEIIGDFHKARLDPITISIRDGKRNNIDGQCRVSAIKSLYNSGKINTPMVMCKIIRNATIEQEASIFAKQDDGKTPLQEKQRTKAELVAKDENTTSLEYCLNRHNLTLHNIDAHKALKNIWNKNNSHELLNRIANVISKAWDCGAVKNSTSADIFNGLMCFYNNFSEDIDDKYLIGKLSKMSPDKVRDMFQSYNIKIDPQRKYLKTFSMVYNKSKHGGKIEYV